MIAFVACRHWQDRGQDYSGGCTLGLFDGRPMTDQCVGCPSRKRPEAMPAHASTPQPPPTAWSVRGPQLWARFHRRPRLWTGAAAERIWLAEFDAEIGCGDCREHWRALLAAHPPDLSSPAAYARWQHERHNDTRRRLGQPEMTYDEAAALWGWDVLHARTTA